MDVIMDSGSEEKTITLTNLQWWVYCIVAILLFSISLLLNYIVKRVNDNRLEDRLNKFYDKTPKTRSVQCEQQLETVEKLSLCSYSTPSDRRCPLVLTETGPLASHTETVLAKTSFGSENYSDLAKEVDINMIIAESESDNKPTEELPKENDKAQQDSCQCR